MSLTLAAVMGLAQHCAPGIALEAMIPQVQVESHFNELAIGIKGRSISAKSVAQAAQLATSYIAAGYSVDLGLAQINSHNLNRLGMSVQDAFDPCTSLSAASVILTENYQAASVSYAGIDAINVAWSLYNSGSTTRGFHNGYVQKIWTAANGLLPQMRQLLAPGQPLPTQIADAAPAPGPSDSEGAAPAPSEAEAPKPRWFYGSADTGVIVFK